MAFFASVGVAEVIGAQMQRAQANKIGAGVTTLKGDMESLTPNENVSLPTISGQLDPTRGR